MERIAFQEEVRQLPVSESTTFYIWQVEGVKKAAFDLVLHFQRCFDISSQVKLKTRQHGWYFTVSAVFWPNDSFTRLHSNQSTASNSFLAPHNPTSVGKAHALNQFSSVQGSFSQNFWKERITKNIGENMPDPNWAHFLVWCSSSKNWQYCNAYWVKWWIITDKLCTLYECKHKLFDQMRFIIDIKRQYNMVLHKLFSDVPHTDFQNVI